MVLTPSRPCICTILWPLSTLPCSCTNAQHGSSFSLSCTENRGEGRRCSSPVLGIGQSIVVFTANIILVVKLVTMCCVCPGPPCSPLALARYYVTKRLSSRETGSMDPKLLPDVALGGQVGSSLPVAVCSFSSWVVLMECCNQSCTCVGSKMCWTVSRVGFVVHSCTLCYIYCHDDRLVTLIPDCEHF